ncbi:MAG: hypothetical protein U9Q85_03030 [Patescibacteria group bacterium]|nr:hypothetical protein [Patescibacteria group bacterium]
MARKIIGILIIIIGLIFLSGIISVMFFNLNPLEAVKNLIFSDTKVDNIDTVKIDPGQNDKNSENNSEKKVRTIVVDDNLLDNNEQNKDVVTRVDSTPVFRRSGEKVEENDLLKMAAVFVERFGTYSNQSNFVNLIDLKMFMSKDMQVWADNYIAEMRVKEDGNSLYYGVITRTINQEMNLLDKESGEASVIVHTRRQEATGFVDNIAKSFNQDISVEMVKENNSWKIDAVFWK